MAAFEHDGALGLIDRHQTGVDDDLRHFEVQATADGGIAFGAAHQIQRQIEIAGFELGRHGGLARGLHIDIVGAMLQTIDQPRLGHLQEPCGELVQQTMDVVADLDEEHRLFQGAAGIANVDAIDRML